MILKPLEVPELLLKTEALNYRLIPIHPLKLKISAKARNLRAGYNGELSLEFPLSFLPYDKFLIFHALRIHDANGIFQIDILLLSANFILIIEVKNIWDHVIFDDMGQAVRVENDKTKAFTNPIDQVNLQHLRFLRWLRQFNFPSIPIEKIVVYSNPNTVLKNHTNDKVITEVVMHKEKILQKIDELTRMYHTPCFSEEHLMNLAFQLLTAHVSEEVDILNKYNVSSDELIKGVFCQECNIAPMRWIRGKWNCSSCKTSSKTSHQWALVDYGLLKSAYINNRSARDFLQVDSEKVARNLLQKENFERLGTTSGVKYKMDIDNLVEKSNYVKRSILGRSSRSEGGSSQ